MTPRRLPTLALLLTAALTLAGCGSSGGSTSSTPAAATSSAAASPSPTAPASSTAAATTTITIKNFGYAVPASVAPGVMVTVTNKDSEAHTVTADSGGAFDDTIASGARSTFRAPAKPGRYPFHCNFHANMHGVLVVR